MKILGTNNALLQIYRYPGVGEIHAESVGISFFVGGVDALKCQCKRIVYGLEKR
jgi:hypothetical protein